MASLNSAVTLTPEFTRPRHIPMSVVCFSGSSFLRRFSSISQTCYPIRCPGQWPRPLKVAPALRLVNVLNEYEFSDFFQHRTRDDLNETNSRAPPPLSPPYRAPLPNASITNCYFSWRKRTHLDEPFSPNNRNF